MGAWSKRQDLWFTIQVVLVCLSWYACSCGQNVVNKLALQRFPFPLTIALSSLLNNVLYTIPLTRYLHLKPVRASRAYLLRTIVPISAGRALAVGSAYFGLLNVPVSYAQTIKATMPVFTVLVSRVMLGERQSSRVYVALAPIVVGVFIASVTELQFSLPGLLCSLFSTSLFACLNVLAKKVFQDTSMHPVTLLALNSQLAAVLLFPMWLLRDGPTLWWVLGGGGADEARHEQPPAAAAALPTYLLLSGLLSFGQNLCAFTLIHQLTTLSYAVANAAKRVAVIGASLLWLRNPVTPPNLCGMLLSVAGVLLYNRVKQAEERRRRARSPAAANALDEALEQARFLRRAERNLHFSGLRSTNSDVKLMLSAD